MAHLIHWSPQRYPQAANGPGLVLAAPGAPTAPCYLGGSGCWKGASVWYLKPMGTREMHCLVLSVCTWNTGGEGTWKETGAGSSSGSVLKYDKRLEPTSWLASLSFSLSNIHILVITNNFHRSVQKWRARHITMLLWKWTCEYCVDIWKTLVFRRSNTVALYDYCQQSLGETEQLQECAWAAIFMHSVSSKAGFFVILVATGTLHPEFFCALQCIVLRHTNKQTKYNHCSLLCFPW